MLANVVVRRGIEDQTAYVTALSRKVTERYHQRLGVRFLASNQVEPERISQRRQRAHVTGVQQDPEQMFDGQVVSVVIRV
ncbi:hypothetical protein D3C75_894130 [compost metagenome]